MSKQELITVETITDEAIVSVGKSLSSAMTELGQVADMSRQHGAIVGGLIKVKAVQHLREVLKNPVAEVLLTAGAGICYEVAESPERRMTQQGKFCGVTMGLEQGYLLNDPAGMHFCIFEGKNGAISVMAKRAGLMHKLQGFGATNVDAKAAVIETLPRANDTTKLDAVVEAEASCVVGDKTFRIERHGQFAYRLPCGKFDAPDKNIAQGKRRALRDLLEMVSGERVLIAGDDVESEGGSVTVVDTTSQKITDDSTVKANMWDQQHQTAQRRIKDAAQLETWNKYWSAINMAETKDELRSVYAEIKGCVKTLGQNNVDELLRYAEFVSEQLDT